MKPTGWALHSPHTVPSTKPHFSAEHLQEHVLKPHLKSSKPWDCILYCMKSRVNTLEIVFCNQRSFINTTFIALVSKLAFLDWMTGVRDGLPGPQLSFLIS
jgi:hypothetical protein